MVLTEKQRHDLHAAIAEYLETHGEQFSQSAAQFRKEAQIEEQHLGKKTAAGSTTLEKKWASVVKLQKKVMDLESKITELQNEVRAAEKGQRGAEVVKKEFLPAMPATFELTGHRKAITHVAFHPVFNVCVTASEDSTIKVWDAESGELERSLQEHTKSVNSVCFNQTGNYLASCSCDMSVKLWNFGENKQYNCRRTLLGHERSVSEVLFTPTGEKLISCSRDATIKIWNAYSGLCLETIREHEEWVRCISINDSGNLLASGSHDHSIKIHNLQSKKIVSTIDDHEHVIESLAFSNVSQSSKLADVLRRKASKDSALGNYNSNASGKGDTEGTEFLLTSSRDCSIRCYRMDTKECIAVLTGHENWVRRAMFHPCGTLVVSVAEDKKLCVWDICEQRKIREIKDAHSQFLSTVDIHSKQPLIATGGVDSVIRLWLCK